MIAGRKTLSEVSNTIRLLRIPFSFFLLPVSLFSLCFIWPPLDGNIWLMLMIWHLLIFPSSNGYNSFNDRDTGPIGGLQHPPQPSRLLLYASNCMDLAAIMLSLRISTLFALFVALYALFSRLYSSRVTRLKKYPFTSFFIVVFFQGAWVLCANVVALAGSSALADPAVMLGALTASCFTGTMYPLTQIYQHEADRRDRTETLSLKLGVRGTFIFSGLMFIAADMFLYLAFSAIGKSASFWLYNMLILPATLYFAGWAWSCFRDPAKATFRHTMNLLLVSSLLNNIAFAVIIMIR